MTMAMDPKIACIGAGYWGKNLVRNFHALGMLSCVCETSPERRAELAAAYPDAHLTDSFEEVLADPQVAAFDMKEGFVMPKIEITYQQVLEAVKQLAPKEREQLEAALREKQPAMDYPAFTVGDSLWKVIGAGKGAGGPAARQHDEYLYQKDW